MFGSDLCETIRCRLGKETTWLGALKSTTSTSQQRLPGLLAPDWPIQNWVYNLYSARLQTTALYTDMANDNIYALFDTLSQQSLPPFHPRAGTTYFYVWQDVTKMNDWCADGYRWRQNGMYSAKCSNGEQTKTYFRVCYHMYLWIRHMQIQSLFCNRLLCLQ